MAVHFEQRITLVPLPQHLRLSAGRPSRIHPGRALFLSHLLSTTPSFSSNSTSVWGSAKAFNIWRVDGYKLLADVCSIPE